VPTDLLSGKKSSGEGPVDLMEPVDTYTDGMSATDTPEQTNAIAVKALDNKAMPADLSFMYEQTAGKSDFVGGFMVLADTLRRLPEEQAAAVLKLHAGAEAASVVDKGWTTKALKTLNQRSDAFTQGVYKQYGDKQVAPFVPIKITDIAGLGQNIAFSATSMLTGLGAAAPLILVPEPTMTTKVAAWGLGTVASGKAAYEMATYDIMQSYLEAQNEIEPLTPETEREQKKFFNAAAQQYGLWEAVPEALSNLGFAAILTKPLSKMVGKTVAGKIIKKMGALYGQELITEAITQWGQARVEEKAGLREKGTGQISYLQALKEVAPQTILLTTFMAGAGASAVSIKNKVRESFAKETKGKTVDPMIAGLMDKFTDDMIKESETIKSTEDANNRASMEGMPKDVQTFEVKAEEAAPITPKEGGGVVKAYHGTDSQIVGELKVDAQSTEQFYGPAIYLKHTKEGATQYGKNVHEVNVDTTGFLDLRGQSSIHRAGVTGTNGTYDQFLEMIGEQDSPKNFKEYLSRQKQVRDDLVKDGYKGIIDDTQIVVFDKSKLSTPKEGEVAAPQSETLPAIEDRIAQKVKSKQALEDRVAKVDEAKQELELGGEVERYLLDNKIKKYKDGFLKEELSALPRKYVTTNENANTIDQALDELRSRGHDFANEYELTEYLKAWDKRKAELKSTIESNKPRKITLNEMTMLKNRLKNMASGARVGAKFAREDVMRVQEDIIALLEGSEIEGKDRAKFIRTIKNIQTQAQLESALPEILDRVDRIQAAQQVKEARQQKRRALIDKIKAKRYKGIDRLRQYMKLPDVSKMNDEQIAEYDRVLDMYQEGDIFLSQRQIETVDKTDLAGIRTLREARIALAKQAGVPVEDLQKIKVSEWDRVRQDVALSEQNPLYKILVEETHRGFIGADLKYRTFERELERLTIKARQSKDRGIIERAIPTDDIVFQWMEAENKADLEESMTPEELELAQFLQNEYAKALEYLVKTEALKTGRENYITNVRRGFFEALKEDGLMVAAKEMADQYKQDEEVFNILDQQTGNVLPLEKFFQFAMRRSGQIKPTTNVAKASSTYFRMLFKKQALDAIVPKMMIYAQAVTPTKLTPLGLEFDNSIKNFMKEWINTKKGRKTKLFVKPGGVMDAIVMGGRALTTIWDLGANIPVGLAANIGETAAADMAIGHPNMAKGIARLATPKGQEIVNKYEGFTGKSLWRELIEPSKNIGDKTMTALFGLFASSSTRMNKISLLGLMTDQEYESGEISTDRLTEIKLKIGKTRIISGGKSILESTTEGGVLMQYKAWAEPIIRTVSADIANLVKKVKEGGALKSEEFGRLRRGLELTTAALMIGAFVGEDDKDDKSFSAELLRKARREALTLLGALDPSLWLGEPRVISFLGELGRALHQVVVLERYKKSKKLKGVAALERMAVPRAIKPFIPEDTEGKPKKKRKAGQTL